MSDTYSPGVKVGDWWEYGSVDVECGFLCPREIRELQEVASIHSIAAEVVGDEVTTENQVTFTNETKRTYTLSGNVETGQGNLTYPPFYYLIARDLFPGQPVYNSPAAPTISSTVTADVAGQPRLVNFLFQSGSIYGVQYTSSQGWDREKGVLVEARFFTGTGISVRIYLTDGVWLYSPGFGISLTSSSVTLEFGESRNVTVMITSRGGWKGQVNVSVTVQPDGPLLSLTPTTLNVPDYIPVYCGDVICQEPGRANSTLTISAPKDMPLGTYIATVTTSNQTISRSTPLTITVTGPDFRLSSFPPPIGTIHVQASEDQKTWFSVVTIHVTSLNGFGGQVLLTADVSPEGLSASFTRDPQNFQPAYPSYTLDVQPDSNNYTLLLLNSTDLGSYQVTVAGTSGFRSHTITFHVQVVPPTVGDFALTAIPQHITMQPGMNVTSTITLTSLDSFAGEVNLNAIEVTLKALPGPITSDPFGPRPYLAPRVVTVTENGSATVTLTVQTPAIPIRGDYIIIIQASCCFGFLFHTLNVTVTVGPAPTPDTTTPGPTSPGTGQGQNAPLILGLSPLEFYSIIGTIGAVVAAAAFAFSLRRNGPVPRTETTH